MKTMIPILLAALVAAALSTPTPAFAAGPACHDDESEADCIARLWAVSTTLAQVNAQCEDEIAAKDRQIADLRVAQASAASAGDGPEVARLEQLLAAVTAERDEYKSQLDAAQAEIVELKGQVASLQGQVTELSDKFDDLNARLTAFLTEKAEAPVAAATPEPVSTPAPAGDTRLAVYERPELDPTVYGRMAYVGYTPEIPSPIAHPGVRWRDAGNCLRIENPAGAEYHMFVRVQGADFYLDDSKHTERDEVLLAPGRSVGHCQGESAPVTRTAARVSTAPSSEYHWDGRRQESVERSSHVMTYANRYGSDRVDDDGPPLFRE